MIGRTNSASNGSSSGSYDEKIITCLVYGTQNNNDTTGVYWQTPVVANENYTYVAKFASDNTLLIEFQSGLLQADIVGINAYRKLNGNKVQCDIQQNFYVEVIEEEDNYGKSLLIYRNDENFDTSIDIEFNIKLQNRNTLIGNIIFTKDTDNRIKILPNKPVKNYQSFNQDKAVNFIRTKEGKRINDFNLFPYGIEKIDFHFNKAPEANNSFFVNKLQLDAEYIPSNDDVCNTFKYSFYNMYNNQFVIVKKLINAQVLMKDYLNVKIQGSNFVEFDLEKGKILPSSNTIDIEIDKTSLKNALGDSHRNAAIYRKNTIQDLLAVTETENLYYTIIDTKIIFKVIQDDATNWFPSANSFTCNLIEKYLLEDRQDFLTEIYKYKGKETDEISELDGIRNYKLDAMEMEITYYNIQDNNCIYLYGDNIKDLNNPVVYMSETEPDFCNEDDLWLKIVSTDANEYADLDYAKIKNIEQNDETEYYIVEAKRYSESQDKWINFIGQIYNKYGKYYTNTIYFNTKMLQVKNFGYTSTATTSASQCQIVYPMSNYKNKKFLYNTITSELLLKKSGTETYAKCQGSRFRKFYYYYFDEINYDKTTDIETNLNYNPFNFTEGNNIFLITENEMPEFKMLSLFNKNKTPMISKYKVKPSDGIYFSNDAGITQIAGSTNAMALTTREHHAVTATTCVKTTTEISDLFSLKYLYLVNILGVSTKQFLNYYKGDGKTFPFLKHDLGSGMEFYGNRRAKITDTTATQTITIPDTKAIFNSENSENHTFLKSYYYIEALFEGVAEFIKCDLVNKKMEIGYYASSDEAKLPQRNIVLIENEGKIEKVFTIKVYDKSVTHNMNSAAIIDGETTSNGYYFLLGSPTINETIGYNTGTSSIANSLVMTAGDFYTGLIPKSITSKTITTRPVY